MDDLHLDFEDQQQHVTASAIVRVTGGSIALSLFSPEGGECEVFLAAADARRIADALKLATASAGVR